MGLLRMERLRALLRLPVVATLSLELLIVFVGMFGAFFVNDLQQERVKQKAVREALVAIHGDLRQYARNGQDPEAGFVLSLRQLDARFRAGLAQRNLSGRPPLIFGDHYQLELLHNLLDSGKLSDLDLPSYRRLARFAVIHRNFMRHIERLNDYTLNRLGPALREPEASFFDPHTGKLRPEHELLPGLITIGARFAELTAQLAIELADELEQRHRLPAVEGRASTPAR